MKTFRLVRNVYTVHLMPPYTAGRKARYVIQREPLGGGSRTTVDGPTGRLRSFATASGAQRVCDRLNADEHKRVSG